MSVFYTNTDQFLNKRDELLLVITDDEPDVIVLSEVLPKVLKYPINPVCMVLPNYNMYLSFDPLSPEFGSGKRGLAICQGRYAMSRGSFFKSRF